MRDSTPFGFLNIDKPAGVTSHDVVAQVRRGLKVKKVGHAGTLDPMATGVLVLCLGKATRLSEYAMSSTKCYRARVYLGVTTDTYDAEGEIIQRQSAGHITREAVERTLATFTGDIQQLPPMYSAVKQGGRKLYELARAGEEIERKARKVTIESLVICEWSPPEFVLDVVCSAGTYVRSLAHDLGEVLGVGAHLSGLVRTASGGFRLEDAVALKALLQDKDWHKYVLPPDVVLSDHPAFHLDASDTEHVEHGRPLPNHPATGKDGQVARAYDADGRFIAILKAEGGVWRPHKVFSAR